MVSRCTSEGGKRRGHCRSGEKLDECAALHGLPPAEIYGGDDFASRAALSRWILLCATHFAGSLDEVGRSLRHVRA